MAEAIGIILFTMLLVGGSGLVLGEVAHQIDVALIRRRAHKAEAAARMRAYREAAIEAAQQTNMRPVYVAKDQYGAQLLVTDDVAAALRAIVGKQGAFIVKDGRKVAQNRTLVQGGKK